MGPRTYARGALANLHQCRPHPVLPSVAPIIRPAVATEDRTRRDRIPPPIPLMSLVVPVPTRYRLQEVPPPAVTITVAPGVSTVMTTSSATVCQNALPSSRDPICSCVFYAMLRNAIISSMRWSLTDDLALILLKAEQCYPTLNPLVRSNVVAAAVSVREEDRCLAASRSSEVDRNHQIFLSNFEEWVRENRPIAPLILSRMKPLMI